jgi:hypothetical protein
MRTLTIFISLLFLLNSCATNKKFEKETCQQIYGLFTKSVNCLELKFININPKKYKKYEETHKLILKALADQVYENRINNVQVWLIYDDIILNFKKAKKKEGYLTTVLSKYY